MTIKLAQKCPYIRVFSSNNGFILKYVTQIVKTNTFSLFKQFQWYVHPIYLFISKHSGCPTVATIALVLYKASRTSYKPPTNLQQNSNKLPTNLQSSFQHGVPFHPPDKTLFYAPWNMKLALKKFHIILGSCNPFLSSRWSHPLGWVVLRPLAQALLPLRLQIRSCKYCQYWLWKNRYQVSYKKKCWGRSWSIRTFPCKYQDGRYWLWKNQNHLPHKK